METGWFVAFTCAFVAALSNYELHQINRGRAELIVAVLEAVVMLGALGRLLS